MPITETVCGECDHNPDSETKHCPECGAEEPWEEQNAYEFDEDDLPIIFAYNVYDDNHGMWRGFLQDYFGVGYNLKESDIANLPSGFPRLKYISQDLYFVITEDLELEGPFLSKQEARQEVQDRDE